jgi:hypothetical protein
MTFHVLLLLKTLVTLSAVRDSIVRWIFGPFCLVYAYILGFARFLGQIMKKNICRKIIYFELALLGGMKCVKNSTLLSL